MFKTSLVKFSSSNTTLLLFAYLASLSELGFLSIQVSAKAARLLT